MATMTNERTRFRATVRVLGEEIVATMDVPDGATAADLIRSAGTSPRKEGWDLLLDGVPIDPGTPMDITRDATLTYVPRIRGG
jgi:hypothetical protein